MGYGLLNYRWVFSAGRFLQSAVASGTSNPNLENQLFRTFQLPPPGVPHVWNDASEPQQRKVEIWARNCWESCRSWRLPSHFWVLLHALNLRHGTDGFTFPPKEGALRIFSPEKSDGFGRVWIRELGYQRPARSPPDHRSRLSQNSRLANSLFLLVNYSDFWIYKAFYSNCDQSICRTFFCRRLFVSFVDRCTVQQWHTNYLSASFLNVFFFMFPDKQAYLPLCFKRPTFSLYLHNCGGPLRNY